MHSWLNLIFLALFVVLLPSALSQSCTDPNEILKPCNGLLASNLACDTTCASNPICPGACSNLLGPGKACRCRDGYVRQTLVGGACVPLSSCGTVTAPGNIAVSSTTAAPGNATTSGQ
uniref:TIL domain-containing protein n=1 Tax=Plectus sambesii TaxID=2011161 RepID=A0A914WLC6_9BILA